jgi:putative DNA primase/helicase
MSAEVANLADARQVNNKRRATSVAGVDAGIKKQLADAICEKDSFALDRGGRLYVFKSGVYAPYGERLVKQRVKELTNERNQTKVWSAHLANEVVAYISADTCELWERPPLDRINLLNGILKINLKSGKSKLLPHSPDFLSPIQLPVKYDVKAQPVAWEKFVAATFPEDAQEVAWQIPAWLMTPETSIQKSILLLGEGANGKSTFLAAVSAFIGKHNVTSLSLHKLGTNRFAAARLVGKLANVCPDLPSTHLDSTSMFKAITGGDAIGAERKHMEEFDFIPYTRLVFSANHPPRSADSTHAFFRRWIVLPFTRTFEEHEQIPRNVLDARLSDAKELSGVLNRAIDVLASLLKDGFSESVSMRSALEEFRQTTDPLAVWLEHAVIERPDVRVTKHKLMLAYNEACERAGRPVMTAQAFGRAVRRIRPDLHEAQRTVAGKLEWCWLGIGLKQ